MNIVHKFFYNHFFLALCVNGEAIFKNNLTVEGDTTLNGNTTIGDYLFDELCVNAVATFKNDLIVGGDTILSNTTIGDTDADQLCVNATAEFKTDVTIQGETCLDGDIKLSNNTLLELDMYQATDINDIFSPDPAFEMDGKYYINLAEYMVLLAQSTVSPP